MTTKATPKREMPAIMGGLSSDGAEALDSSDTDPFEAAKPPSIACTSTPGVQVGTEAEAATLNPVEQEETQLPCSKRS